MMKGFPEIERAGEVGMYVVPPLLSKTPQDRFADSCLTANGCGREEM